MPSLGDRVAQEERALSRVGLILQQLRAGVFQVHANGENRAVIQSAIPSTLKTQGGMLEIFHGLARQEVLDEIHVHFTPVWGKGKLPVFILVRDGSPNPVVLAVAIGFRIWITFAEVSVLIDVGTNDVTSGFLI